MFRPLVALAAVIATAAAVHAAEAWQNTSKIITTLRLQPSARVAHIGPASNLVPALAAAVPKGHVYVLDRDESVVNGLRQIVSAKNLQNATVLSLGASGGNLPRQLDLIVVVSNTRQLRDEPKLLRTISRSLAPGGRLVIVDFYRRPMRVGPPLKERLASHDALKLMTRAGFRLDRRIKANEYQYVFVLTPRRRAAAR